MSLALYNEIDGYAANWLDNLVAAGHIAPGRVERRSIADLTPADVAGTGQRHFFAGIGGWSYALRLAGVPDDADIWTGSCPCQPFSDAGARGGTRDPRHLWPAWFALIRECRPPTIFGEQVASRAGLAWLDLVRADLEGCGYAVGASDLCAAGVGAPHIRQRLYFVAYAGRERCEGKRLRVQPRQSRFRRPEVGGAARLAEASLLGNSGRDRARQHDGELRGDEAQHEVGAARGDHASEFAGAAGRHEGGMGDAAIVELARSAGCRKVEGAETEGSTRLNRGDGAEHASAVGTMADGAVTGRSRSDGRQERGGLAGPRANSPNDPWRHPEWVPCSDGVSRPIESGTFPLAHGVSGRMVVRRTVEQASSEIREEEHWYNRTGALTGFGNAIVPQLAAVFIRCAQDAWRSVK